MDHGRNRPLPAPRIPGTDLRSPDVPLAIIRRPARSATQSAQRPRHWVLEFEPSRAPELDPLMGWTTSNDPYRTIRLQFPDVASAIRYAESQDWRYIVLEESRGAHAPAPSSGSAAGQARHRLFRGVDVPGARRLPYPAVAAARLGPATASGAAQNGRSDPGRGRDNAAFDPVEEAALESFPASDPPAWTGTTIGAPRKIPG